MPVAGRQVLSSSLFLLLNSVVGLNVISEYLWIALIDPTARGIRVGIVTIHPWHLRLAPSGMIKLSKFAQNWGISWDVVL